MHVCSPSSCIFDCLSALRTHSTLEQLRGRCLSLLCDNVASRQPCQHSKHIIIIIIILILIVVSIWAEPSYLAHLGARLRRHCGRLGRSGIAKDTVWSTWQRQDASLSLCSTSTPTWLAACPTWASSAAVLPCKAHLLLQHCVPCAMCCAGNSVGCRFIFI